MRKQVITSAFLFLCASSLRAAPIEFDFKDPKGVNNVVFKTDAPLESINGTGTGVAGKVTFDPSNPGAIKGKIVLDVKSLRVPNPRMQEHLHGPDWMNAAQHPDIVFEVVQAKNVKTDGNTTTADVLGKMTIKGSTKEMTVPVKITYLKDRLKDRQGKEGDLLVIRSNFNIKRSDFGINASKGEDKVSNEIELSLSVAGSAPKA
jgi:polyisoprenoid-binding protein YceI